MDKDKEIVQIQKKLECQDSQFFQLQQQTKEIQQHNSNIKNTDKLEVAKINKTISNNNDEIFWLRNPNKILVTKMKKLKNKKQEDWKLEQANRDIENKLLEKDEEICCLKNHNQDLMEQIKKLNVLIFVTLDMYFCIGQVSGVQDSSKSPYLRVSLLK